MCWPVRLWAWVVVIARCGKLMYFSTESVVGRGRGVSSHDETGHKTMYVQSSQANKNPRRVTLDGSEFGRVMCVIFDLWLGAWSFGGAGRVRT